MLEPGGDFQPLQFVIAHPGAIRWLTGGGVNLDIVVWNDKVIDKDYYTRNFLKNAVNEIIK